MKKFAAPFTQVNWGAHYQFHAEYGIWVVDEIVTSFFHITGHSEMLPFLSPRVPTFLLSKNIQNKFYILRYLILWKEKT